MEEAIHPGQPINKYKYILERHAGTRHPEFATSKTFPQLSRSHHRRRCDFLATTRSVFPWHLPRSSKHTPPPDRRILTSGCSVEYDTGAGRAAARSGNRAMGPGRWARARGTCFSPSRRRRASATGRAGLRNPSPFELLHREKANKVFGKRSARLLAVFTTGRPSSSAAGGYHRRLLHGLLYRAAYSTCDVRDTVIVNVILSTESALAADRQFSELSMAVFADALKPEKFSGVHFKRWQIKCTLWLKAMHVFWVSKGKSEGDLSDADLQRFTEANTLFRGAILSALTDRLVDVYMHIKDGKELWDALEAKFGASDAGSDLYIMKSFHDFKMSFATALKHKRTKISVEELIASLDVEEKARAKDTKGGEGHSVANTVQNQRNQSKGKGKFKPNKTTNFKKKKNKAELPCFTCGELGHFSKDCPERADRRGKRGGNGQSSKTVNTVTRDCSVLMGNGSAASVLGIGTVDLKFISGKIVQLKNVQHVPSMNKNLISGSLLLRDGFKIVLESNKVVVSRHGLFIGKGYVSGGLFRLSLSDFNNKCVNHICGGVNDDASLWHGRLCHITPELNAPTEVFEPPREISPEEDNNEAPRKSKRQRVEKSFGNDFIVYLVDDTPTSISEAYASPDADNWKEAVQSELDSILSNGTWELTERPYGCKPVGCKPDGTIEKYKARLVAKGYTKKEGKEFFDTYSPVARMTTIRVLLFLAVSYSLIIHQMDVKTAFLNGELEEEIYMEQPDGFVVKGQESKVSDVPSEFVDNPSWEVPEQALAEEGNLKQAPKQWHEKFDTTLTSAGFAVNETDSCVYYRYGGGKGVILCLYVDDILIFGTDIDVINEIKSFLSTKFDMKDLGEADMILNIKLIKDESGITLSQTHYVEKVLSQFGYIDSKPSPTPYDPSVTLKKNKRIGVNQLKYSQIIGSLMYLASATRPDISFAVSKLSRFMSNPGTDHWHALERVMCYLKGTMSYGIHYSGHPVLEGYSDANWISDDELYATSGYVFMLGGGAVSWRSCKQTILTKSTMEAELAALDTASVEADWLRELLMDLPVVEKPIPAILMNCDNQTAIAKVNSDKENAKSSRHVRRRVKSVRKMRHSGVISVTYIQTEKNLADPFTKGLSRNVIDIASREMDLRPI
ncbi:hypothetical protein U9M48_004466 [Paspalum notatum var. saurae]|uniref:CCHC-type domain-containing protein n=1 Tax=Paspalum notatum var. saurae TaxID=547442 RepID=A0AAQ3PVL9_PASNO